MAARTAAEQQRWEFEEEEEEEEEEESGYLSDKNNFYENQPSPVVPDFAVLFFTRTSVWVGELCTVLRVLIVVGEWWEEAAVRTRRESGLSEKFNLPALAITHLCLTRKAYARFLGVRKSWDFGKNAVGFGQQATLSPRK